MGITVFTYSFYILDKNFTELTCKLPLLQEHKGPETESPYRQNLRPFASHGKQLGYS